MVMFYLSHLMHGLVQLITLRVTLIVSVYKLYSELYSSCPSGLLPQDKEYTHISWLEPMAYSLKLLTHI